MSDAPQGPESWAAPVPPAPDAAADPYASPDPYAPPGAVWGPPPPPPIPINPYGVVLPQTPPPGRKTTTTSSVLAIVVAVLVCVGAIALLMNRDTHHVDSPVAFTPLRPVPLIPNPSVPTPALPTHPVVITANVTKNRTASGTVVDQAMARQVLSRYWPMHEQALVSRDLTELHNMSAGPARRWEQASVACGCLRVFTPRPLLRASYFVPRQTSFPATFVTEALTNVGGTYWSELLVFTKHAAGAPWFVSEDSGFGPAPGESPSLGHPDIGHDGYDQPVTAAQSATAYHVAARLAAVWQQAKDTGTVPAASGFDLTGQAGDRVANLASYRQDAVQVDGSLGHYSFSVSKADRPVQVSDHGDDLVCQPIHEVVQHRALPGQEIRQDSAREVWGPGLAPGAYQQVTTTDVWQTCFLIPPRGGPIEVFDQNNGGMRATVPSTLT